MTARHRGWTSSKNQERGPNYYSPKLDGVLERQDVRLVLKMSRENGVRLIHATAPGHTEAAVEAAVRHYEETVVDGSAFAG